MSIICVRQRRSLGRRSAAHLSSQSSQPASQPAGARVLIISHCQPEHLKWLLPRSPEVRGRPRLKDEAKESGGEKGSITGCEKGQGGRRKIMRGRVLTRESWFFFCLFVSHSAEKDFLLLLWHHPSAWKTYSCQLRQVADLTVQTIALIWM